ncbi:hypothetical protein M3936_09930 [Sutcliffiella horikoshii]|uniref:hypothetical protein n=1 Tax=Sutcliffiella horikoshii TaxID=79883 RepID=UPI00203F2F65|nr:hypothetical protein [Sutcliffiella horikoshii]MCM3617898.1 hypothetical protein [Sutcliffiella horikoshii]
MNRIIFILILLVLGGCTQVKEKGIEAEIDFEQLNLEEYVFTGIGIKTMSQLNRPEPEEYRIFQKELKREGEKVIYYTIADKNTTSKEEQVSIYAVTRDRIVLEESDNMWYFLPSMTILENKQEFEDFYRYEINPTFVNATTPAGEFLDCLEVTTFVEDYPRARVTYCPGVGEVRDERNDITVEDEKWFTAEELVDYEYLDLDEEGVEKEQAKIKAQHEEHYAAYQERIKKVEEELEQQRQKESYGRWENKEGLDVFTNEYFEVYFPMDLAGFLDSEVLPDQEHDTHYYFKLKIEGTNIQDTIFEIRQSVLSPAEFRLDTSDGSESLYIDSRNGFYYYFIYNKYENASKELTEYYDLEERIYQLRKDLDQIIVRLK